MEMEVKVSIIIPVYNAETYMEECFASIFNQTLKEIEVIVIDDGSTDKSVEIAEKWAERDERIVVLRQNQNKGASVARNRGILTAKGRYLAFCDADDYYCDVDALENMVNACEKHHVSVCGSYKKFLRNGELIDSPLLREFQIGGEDWEGVTFREFQSVYDYQSFIFERNLIEENHIFFPEYLRYQDPPFFVKAMISAERFWIVPKVLYCYRLGHQDEGGNRKKIKYILMGIRDNMQMAIENGLYKMRRDLVEVRLNEGGYYGAMLEYPSIEVYELLKKIAELNQKMSYPAEIKALKVYDSSRKFWELLGMKQAVIEAEDKQNQSLGIYRKIALLRARGIGFSELLQQLQMREIYVYGTGEIGRVFLSGLNDDISVKGIFDRNFGKEIGIGLGVQSRQMMVTNADEIPDDDLPIIVTTAAAFCEISLDLMKKGIRRERILALHTILTYGVQEEVYKPGVKQFLITGGQFGNKGKQCLLFAAISELRRRVPDAIIWYLPADEPEQYTDQVKKEYRMLFLTNGIGVHSQLFDVLPGLTAILDISSDVLNSHWSEEERIRYMRILRIAYGYKIPLYLMPQSFEMFDFTEEEQEDLKKYLPCAERIFVREKKGYDLLRDTYGLNNVTLFNDLILQNRKIEQRYIYQNNREVKSVGLATENNVGIVPNIRNYEFSSKEELVRLYRDIIGYLLQQGRTVYIIPYSDVQSACLDIYELFEEQDRIIYCNKPVNCMEYEQFFQNFDFLITSHYHAVVQAFKGFVPCIAIGWADQYKELLSDFQQETYVFDVREEIKKETLLNALDRMCSDYKKESEKIAERLPSMQQENCFDVLKELQNQS